MSEHYLRFKSQYPSALLIDMQHLNELTAYLQSKGWVTSHEKLLQMEKPGEGNMNFVLRVTTDGRSVIVKQARPWVEKYPQIEAPIERIEAEARFYQLLSENKRFQPYMPALIGYDKDNFLLVMEDLGQNADYTFVYQEKEVFHDKELMLLLDFINRLHHTDFNDFQHTFPPNQALKKLNHEHIFLFPYREDHGFDLDTIQEGLQELSLPFKHHDALKAKILLLGDIYLGTGPVLIHGDYYPGSWLKTKSGPKVIDPEFAFFGRPEFDMGVMAAHLKMARLTDEKIREALQAYQKPHGFDADLFTGFCGAEILRRIMGLAQLPLDLTLHEKARLLEWAQLVILEPQQNTMI